MSDLTAAVEAAAAALHRAAVATTTEPDQAPLWEELPAMTKHGYREYVLPAIAAAAPILRAQVLAEAREAVDDIDPGECIDQFQAVGRALAAIDALGAEMAP